MRGKGKVPFVRLLLPLMAGMAFEKCFHLVNVVLPLVLITGFVGALLLLFHVAYRWHIYRHLSLQGLVLHLFLFSLGALLVQLKSDSAQSFEKQPADGLVISVDNEPKLQNGILRFEGKVVQVLQNGRPRTANGQLLVAVRLAPQEKISLAYGDLLLTGSNFSEIAPPHNPGEFDYKSYLANKQIHSQIFLASSGEVIRLRKNSGNPVIAFALSLRKKQVERFNRYLPSREAASIASTLILGYRADLSPEVLSAYSKTGTMHVLSVSGMHVALVFIVLNLALKSMDKRRWSRMVKSALIISLIWFYALITGFSPSVLRSALMLSFFVLGKSLNRSHNSYNLIAISAFFLLIYNPFFLFDVGFQLSYLAVLGLIYIHPKVYHLVYFENRIMDHVWNYSALSVAAQLATFPLSVFYFHQFPVYFLISNLFIVLPVTLIMYLGFAFLFIPAALFSTYLGKGLDFLILLVNKGLFTIEHARFSTVDGIWINVFELGMLSFGILTLLMAFQSKKKPLLACSLVLFLILSFSLLSKRIQQNEQKEIIVYSLRKNYAIAYINGRRARLVTDLPDSSRIVPFSIQPALAMRGIVEVKFDRKVDSEYRRFRSFRGYRVMTWDRSLNFKTFSIPVTVDALLITGNPYLDLRKLKGMVRFSRLIIDGTNPDYRIKKWQAEARELGMSAPSVLRNNYACIISFP